MDLSLYPHVAPVVHHAVACKPVVQTVLVGVTWLNAVLASSASMAFGAGLAWYIRGRGLTGVANDINNIKQDIVDLKNKVSSAPVATAAV